MRQPNYIRLVSLLGGIAILSVSLAVEPSTFSSTHQAEQQLITTGNPVKDSNSPEPQATQGEYYSVRQDVRRCVSPLCGGYWVRRVNQSRTQCANRRWLRECYVAEIDWNGQPEVEQGKVVLRGAIVARRFPRFGNLGALRVTESWQSPTDRLPNGTFYRVRDRGVRCITHPCLTHSAAKLNSRGTQNIAGADLAGTGADGGSISEAVAGMTRPEGVIVAGYFATVTGPGGRAQTLRATKFYLRAGTQIGGPPTRPGRCIKTGCSSEVCADSDLVTPCIFRPEFACYQRAICERQANGECGFTQTPELLSCLARERRPR